MVTTSKTDVYITPEQNEHRNLIKPVQCTGAELHTSVFSSAGQSEENKISRQGCGLSVIRLYCPSVLTAGSRSNKHSAMSAHHPACLSCLPSISISVSLACCSACLPLMYQSMTIIQFWLQSEHKSKPIRFNSRDYEQRENKAPLCFLIIVLCDKHYTFFFSFFPCYF